MNSRDGGSSWLRTPQQLTRRGGVGGESRSSRVVRGVEAPAMPMSAASQYISDASLSRHVHHRMVEASRVDVAMPVWTVAARCLAWRGASEIL